MKIIYKNIKSFFEIFGVKNSIFVEILYTHANAMHIIGFIKIYYHNYNYIYIFF